VYMRLYNTTSTPCEASIKNNLGKPIREVTHVDFNGEAMADQQALKKGKGTITVQVRPAQIVTLAMKF
nr:hypothetical protein [Candidatus Sigynarchaeota archaeon]